MRSAGRVRSQKAQTVGRGGAEFDFFLIPHPLPAAFGQRDQATGNAECENQKKPILAPAHFCRRLHNQIIISRANATLHVYWDIVIYIHPEIAFPTLGVTRC